jgi:Zn-dependent metalloprotease
LTCAHPVCCVLPPHLLERVASHGRTVRVREAAAATLALSSSLLSRRRHVLAEARAAAGPDAPALGHRTPLARTIRDAHHRERTLGTALRREGQAACGDTAADEAYDGLGATFAFYLDVLGRNGIDGRDGAMSAFVHYGRRYDNAFYDGTEMCFGDGDGELFNRFTIALDVIGHELTHGVTGTTAGLDYHDQPGALNESVSDRVGAAIRQGVLGLAVADPDGWLIGKGLLADGVHGRALRDMMAPGTAYDDPQLGKDPQPDTMKGYVVGRSDNGGVHVNSGIPNKAFYLLANNLGDTVKAVRVTYETLRSDDVPQGCDFSTWCAVEIKEAERLFGADGRKAAEDAWSAVGVMPAAAG